ncbi:MAG: hypothetical protein QM487_10670 [Candidatus Marithrix sp.]
MVKRWFYLVTANKQGTKGFAEISLVEYFTRYPGIEIQLQIRSGKFVKVTLSSAQLLVKAHGQKRFVVALKV